MSANVFKTTFTNNYYHLILPWQKLLSLLSSGSTTNIITTTMAMVNSIINGQAAAKNLFRQRTK